MSHSVQFDNIYRIKYTRTIAWYLMPICTNQTHKLIEIYRRLTYNDIAHFISQITRTISLSQRLALFQNAEFETRCSLKILL